MRYRTAQRLGTPVSEVGLGTWQLGADWGSVSEQDATDILRTAVETGVTFLDTADVYGNGRSETIIGKFLRTLPDGGQGIFVATKLGRRGYPDGYTYDSLRSWTLESIDRLGRGQLDLTQLHCIPMRHMQAGQVFDWLRKLKSDKLIKHFGASVESMEEAKVCLQQEGCDSLQIIFNIFRQKPIHELFAEAKEKGVAIIVRLPLASGLLAGKFSKETHFAENDHRNYNKDGEKFNVGETFAGLPFEKGVELADRIKPLVPREMSMAEMAVRWILDFDAVTTVIPGASRVSQAQSNARPSDLPRLSPEVHFQLAEMYEADVKSHIRGAY
jgi:aryl-alcohol dehydrogenase-like predicted oxidoreductase